MNALRAAQPRTPATLRSHCSKCGYQNRAKVFGAVQHITGLLLV